MSITVKNIYLLFCRCQSYRFCWIEVLIQGVTHNFVNAGSKTNTFHFGVHLLLQSIGIAKFTNDKLVGI